MTVKNIQSLWIWIIWNFFRLEKYISLWKKILPCIFSCWNTFTKPNKFVEILIFEINSREESYDDGWYWLGLEHHLVFRRKIMLNDINIEHCWALFSFNRTIAGPFKKVFCIIFNYFHIFYSFHCFYRHFWSILVQYRKSRPILVLNLKIFRRRGFVWRIYPHEKKLEIDTNICRRTFFNNSLE